MFGKGKHQAVFVPGRGGPRGREKKQETSHGGERRNAYRHQGEKFFCRKRSQKEWKREPKKRGYLVKIFFLPDKQEREKKNLVG